MRLIQNIKYPIYLMSSEEIINKKKEIKTKFGRFDVQFTPIEIDMNYKDEIKTIKGEAIVRRDSEIHNKFNTKMVMIDESHFDKESNFNKKNDELREKHHKIDFEIEKLMKSYKEYYPDEIDTFEKVKKEIRVKRDGTS